jgi:hypothetical protein
MTPNICKSCGAELIPGKDFCPKCLLRTSVVTITKNQSQKDTPENRAKNMKEFKVLGIVETWNVITGVKSNKKIIEDELYSYGLDGWSVKAMTTRQIPGIGTLAFEDLIILERDMPLEP